MNGKKAKTMVLLAGLLALLFAGFPAYGAKSPDTSAGDGPKGVVTHSLPAGTKLHGTLTVEYEAANGAFPPTAYLGGVNNYKVKAYLRLLKSNNLQTFYLELMPSTRTVSLTEGLATQELLMPYLRYMIIDRFFPQEPGLCLFLRSASNFSEWYESDVSAGKYVAISDVEFAVNDNGGYCPGP